MVALGIGWAAMANESATVALDPEKWEPAWQEGAEELIPGEYLVRFVPGVRTAEAEEIDGQFDHGLLSGRSNSIPARHSRKGSLSIM